MHHKTVSTLFGRLVLLVAIAAAMLAMNHTNTQLTEAANQYMVSPVRGSFVVTQEFGGGHLGIDIFPSSSDAWYVYASSTCYVEEARTGSYRGDTSRGGAGNFIVCKSTPGDWNAYKGYRRSVIYIKHYHLSAVYVKTGDTIVQGQRIGKIGNTGNTIGATGNHLHFQINENARSDQDATIVNPREYVRFYDGKDKW